MHSGMLMNRSALQRVALEGKIFHNGCGTTIVGGNRISKTPPTKQRKAINVSQDLSSAVSQLQRIASDQAELLKKLYENQEKQDLGARRAAR
jgi:peptidoglycan hydrolase CwlO-like protein